MYLTKWGVVNEDVYFHITTFALHYRKTIKKYATNNWVWKVLNHWFHYPIYKGWLLDWYRYETIIIISKKKQGTERNLHCTWQTSKGINKKAHRIASTHYTMADGTPIRQSWAEDTYHIYIWSDKVTLWLNLLIS